MTGSQETAAPDHLDLAECLALVALRDEDGKRVIGQTEFDCGLAGAVLAELALARRIDLAGRTLRVVDPRPVGDPLLDPGLARMAAEPRERKPAWWVGKLRGRDLRDAVHTRLISRGLVREQEVRALGITWSTRFPAVDPAPEAALRRTVAATLAGDAQPTEFVAVLVALLRATGLLRREFGRVDRRRVAEIVEGAWAGRAVKQVIDSTNAAMMAAITAATTASTTSSN